MKKIGNKAKQEGHSKRQRQETRRSDGKKEITTQKQDRRDDKERKYKAKGKIEKEQRKKNK